jgi:DNA repair photolyase
MYGYDDIKQMTLAAIKKLNDAGIKCTVLTKGLLPTELAEYSKDNEYGITLVSLDEGYRERIEPGAAPYVQRLASLRVLHESGFKTWVSIEPYPTPNIITQDINKILEAVSFTDKLIFGRTNYSKEISAYALHRAFYNEQAEKVINFCKKNHIQFHIKDGTISK